MEESLAEKISSALAQARLEHSSRENALVITKLQEAMMWHSEHQRVMQDLVRRSGVGINNDVNKSPS